jgi:hypothetical protein
MNMTQQKKLKQLVRARMARTGESYTTARRHVLSHLDSAGDLPAGTVAGYPTIGPRQHHDSGLVAQLLHGSGVTAPHTGAAYSEAMIAGLGGGIGFMYAVFEYQNMPPLLTIVAQHHPQPWAPTVLARLGIQYREEHSGKPGPAIARLRTDLTGGRPVLVTVDRSRLPWHGLEPGFGMDPYSVLVAGCHGEAFYLDDEGIRPHEISADAFVDAWSAHRKGRHQAITITGPGQATDLPAAIRDAIGTTIAHLTGPVLGNSFDVNFGFAGMAKLAAQLRDTRTKNGWAKRFGDPVAFFHGVRRLYECLELEYTAPGATRPVYAEFLAEAAPLVDGRLVDAATLISEAGRRWSTLASLAEETASGLGAYTELAEERLALMFSRGPSAADEIRAINVRLDALAAEHAEADPLGDAGRRELFAAMADLVDEGAELEKQAVEQLRAAIGPM